LRLHCRRRHWRLVSRSADLQVITMSALIPGPPIGGTIAVLLGAMAAAGLLVCWLS